MCSVPVLLWLWLLGRSEFTPSPSQNRHAASGVEIFGLRTNATDWVATLTNLDLIPINIAEISGL